MVSTSVIFGFTLILCCCCVLTVADLAKDLLEFKKLLPRRRIDLIAAKYYIFDEEFQHAVQFVRSNEFSEILKQMQKSPRASNLIDYLKKSTEGQDLTPVMRELQRILHNYEIKQVSPGDIRNRELSSFLYEVTQVLPRQQMHNLAARKLRESKPFAKFYKALKDKEFKHLVTAARHSQDLRRSIYKLSMNDVDVDEIIQMVFELLSWGPNPTSARRVESRMISTHCM
ncbi:uncharacterized protein LOC117783769 [Drosophila innubila]|uniref:uncharacterized protein LOC117783769 n=1 Tax=Drosophila innubila TaxID=198719 RepID=UPI00148CAFA2|nr:uncharacterized protein LOC117783769 [Drosophila innubila]